MSAPLSGGCQCGAVRYRIRGVPANPHLCHCRMCQKAAGNYFLPLGWVARADFTLTRGEPAWFHSSGMVRRGFCATCGTPLFFEPLGGDGLNVTLGALDEPERVKPALQSGQNSRLSFFPALADLPEEAEAISADWLAAVAQRTCQHPDHDTADWPPEED
ncbi:Uncharacterized conserved protein [Rhizobium sp. RU35A]|uniref:GFA family protein n=1 Tax=Rhizobium sp. RU35A TaxID=1907414 RepID=UPI0009547BFC|nr:GFA family protein [Rhizobium sp. RU35A]SIP92572.1 Uncharacterized conserved protein [Rhizobium sp. RU35A]